MDPNGSEHVRKPRKTCGNLEKSRENFEKLREKFDKNFFHGAVWLRVLDIAISSTRQQAELQVGAAFVALHGAFEWCAELSGRLTASLYSYHIS